MPLSPLTHSRVFQYVFGEPEGLPILESLVNAHFEAAGLPSVHSLQFLPRELGPEHVDEKLAIVDLVAVDETGRQVNIEVQTTRKPAYFERTLFYWARLYSRQLPKGEDYTGLRPVVSINLLEYDYSPDTSWLHYHRLPHTDHLGFIFVELPKLVRAAAPSPDLKNAAIWGKFLERPEAQATGATPEMAQALQAAFGRMEDFMALTPEVLGEIKAEMEHLDWLSVRNEAKREDAAAMLAEGLPVEQVSRITGLPLEDVQALRA
ncbi:MAG: Rpn family recombination-promoting nuclease/putative transposase [Spirochaetales bacterium]